jgi:DNA segregation ATPase FtsK/SpoIIIE, S-DNA-T family
MSKNRKIKDSSAGRGRHMGGSAGVDDRRREVAGVVALGISAFLLVAMISLQAGHLIMGPFGRVSARLVYSIAGICSYALLTLAIIAAIRTLMEKKPVMPLEIALGTLIGVLSLATLLHLAAPRYIIGGHGPGGVLGEHIASITRALISTAGTALLGVIGLVVAVVVATPLRMRDLLAWVGDRFLDAGAIMFGGLAAVGRFVADVVRAILPEREGNYDDDDDHREREDVMLLSAKDRKRLEPQIMARGNKSLKEAREAIPGSEMAGDTDRTDPPGFGDEDDAPKRKRKKADGDSDDDDLPVAASAVSLPTLNGKGRRRAPAGTKSPEYSADAQQDAEDEMGMADAGGPAVGAAAAVAATVAGAAKTAGAKAALPPPFKDAAAAVGPVIVESRFKHADKAEMAAKEKAAEADRRTFIKLSEGEYQLPSINMLNFDATGQNQVDKTAMLELSARLTQTLENYGVKGDVVAIRPGPVVTMYEFAPAPGTRVNKITNLTDDLALALEALRVRIVAPIPGKAAVGIEVPNKIRDKVFLKEILADDVFRKGKARLPLALGKDIEGGPSVVDMARMPHLLVAGTTGSGKSVAVNAMITSLLYHCSPEDVRMIMVDPKMLELSIYEGVPHLLLPVVTDPKKANLALRWAVEEMDRRYDLLAHAGVRDISTYNDKAVKLVAQFEADKLQRAATIAARALKRANGEEIDPDDHSDDIVVSSDPNDSGRVMVTPPPGKLPFIVIIIDEFADLMMCAPKEVETSVARIAQKARAAGIHLILATQRPSVDVITGLIKANFPSRIAFHVTSKIDSRTILDQTGAEALLGAGDMLFSDRGAAPQRLHGCYVDEDEIQRVVNHLKTQARPVYNMEILKPRDEDGDGGDGAGSGMPTNKSDDEMYDKAVHIVTTTGNASISWVQRQLRIGYNRAARLVEEMEKQGVVSGPDHTNKREVLVART